MAEAINMWISSQKERELVDRARRLTMEKFSLSKDWIIPETELSENLFWLSWGLTGKQPMAADYIWTRWGGY